MLAGRAVPIGLLLLAMVSVQVGASLAKQLFPIVGPQGAAALRLVLSAAMLLVVWRPWRIPLSRRGALAIGAYGVSLGLMNLSFYLALDTIPLGVAVALEFTGPLGLALLSSRRPVDFAWIVLAAAGVLLLTPIGPEAARLDPRGALLAVVAGGFWALYIVFGRVVGGGDRGQAASLGLAVAALAGAPWGIGQVAPHLTAPLVIGLGVAVALLSSAIPYSFELVALAKLPTRTFGILMSLEPAIAAVSGLVILGERLGALQWAAIAGVVAASAGSAATTRAPPAEPAPN